MTLAWTLAEDHNDHPAVACEKDVVLGVYRRAPLVGDLILETECRMTADRAPCCGAELGQSLKLVRAVKQHLGGAGGVRENPVSE